MKDLNKQDVAILAQVIAWAYSNEIEVTLRTNSFYNSDPYPVLIFRKEDRNMEYAFYPLTDISGRAQYLWKEIAVKIGVKPLKLIGFSND